MIKSLDVRALCRKFLDAESEAEVQEIIDGTALMKDSANWRPLDGRETNFNVTSNQASDGGKALTELMTNMVDAVLMKHALLKNIDPKGADAPETMHDAVDQLIKPMRGGKLTYLDPKDAWLREFSQNNLVIGVTGARSKSKGYPCYTFVDNGEGQNPDKFEDTFLSLSKGNKKDIHFVQGKYNMGSSGVLGYCGLKWFKLIVSRRFDGKSPWGFTLVRKRPGGGMPVAEYFVLPDGSIPSFEEDALYPFVKGDGKRYDGMHLSTGTVIKLYDYQIGSKFASGFRGSREALNENLVETILPFRILDFRQKPDVKRGGERAEGIDARGFYGMEYLLLRSHKLNENDEEEDDVFGEEPIAVANIQEPELGKITVTAIPLKREIPGWLNSSRNRVFHAVNGQVQFKETRGYVSQSCGLPALKDRIVIFVDASGLTYEAHNEIWKGDREHIRNTIYGERYQDMVTAAIKASEALKQLQMKVAKEELEQATKTERNELFQKLIDKDPTLRALLSFRDPVISLPTQGGKGGSDAGEDEFKGKYSPTFIRFDGKAKEQGIAIPANRTRPVTARTDAQNNYLQRTENTGHIAVNEEISSRFGVRSQLHNGRLVIYLDPLKGALKVGEKYKLKVSLQDPCMTTPVSDEIEVRVIDEKDEKEQTQPANNNKQKAGEEGNKEGQGKPAPTHGLPPFRLLTRDGRTLPNGEKTDQWPEGLDEHDGGMAVDLGTDGMLYKINYDNSYHLKYRQSARGGDVARDVVTEKYVLGMRIMMMGYEHALKSVQEKNPGLAEYLDDFRKMAAKGAASTVLALAENLPKIVDKSAITESSQDVE